MMPTNILVLMDRFLPSKGGSINWMVNTYSRWTPEKVIFVVPQSDESEKVDVVFPFTVIRVPMEFSSWDPTQPNTLLQYIWLVLRIRTICRKHHIGQIHCAKVLPEGLLAWAVKKLSHISFLIYAHGEEVLFTQSSRKFSWLVPKIYEGASAIISNSLHTQKLLTRIGVTPEKIHVIHPGVDAEKFDGTGVDVQHIREKYRLGQANVLLTVGRLQRRKGQDVVIKALPEIRRSFPKVKYLIVGEGEDEGYLKNLAEEVGVADSVVFADGVATQDLKTLYAVCDIFVMANRQIGGDLEGFGMVFLEANAAGKPVIGGKSGGTAESIQDGITGIQVNGENTDEVARVIVQLLAHPEIAERMGSEGRKRVKRECTWESVVNKTRNVVIIMDSRFYSVEEGKIFKRR